MEAQRYPISVRLVGVMHKEKSKMYMTSVLWSDQSDIVVYRAFQDFEKLHKQMKKAFSTGRKMKKSERVIPKFRDKKTKRGGRNKGPAKSLVRLKFLQKYCNELLSCDPRVSQSADLIQFFQPKERDLQPDFSKNSIMIMPTDDEIGANVGHGNGGNVTQPFVTETYRCVAPYETKDTKNKPFKVVLDEKVDVLIKDKAGWWLVENEEKRMAWFPAPYLEKLDDDDDGDEDDVDGIPERGTLYNAVKSYKATKDDEITVSIGSVVEVLQKSNNGWWLIRYNGKAGYIPSMYLQPYKYPHIHMTTHQERRGSALLPAPPSMLEESHQLSRSQGNLLQLPPVRSSSPRPLQPDGKQKSHSLNILSEQPPPVQPARRTPAGSAATAAYHSPPPTIMVEMDGEGAQQGRRRDSDGSFASSSSGGDSSEFSFSDDLSSSSASSSFNLSHSANDDRLRLSRTPPPAAIDHLSPTSGPEGKMIPSVSDPNLYKGPSTPKVPPRPRTQEILTRCSTVTRKNASRGGLSPTPNEILSR